MPKINLSSLIWPIVVLLIAFGVFYFKPWQTKTPQTISVTAQGKAQATPNIAQITATVETKNTNLDVAREQNGQKVSAIVAKLKDLGLDPNDIKTQNISTSPTYEIQIYPTPPRPNSNSFSTSLQITLHNFDIADEVLQTLTQNGATNLYGPNLTLDENTQNQATSQAREKAVEAARQKAEALAKLSQRKLGQIVSIKEEGDTQFPVPLMARSEVDLEEKTAQIQPGQNDVIINLSVEFALK